MKATGIMAREFNLSNGLEVAVYYPQDEKEIRELLKMAETSGREICPVGNLTRLTRYISPAKLKHDRYMLVSMSKFNRIISYIPENMALIAEAGVTLGQILELTWPQGQFCPALLFLPAQATLGGTVASNQKHLLEHVYGSIANYMGGIELISTYGVLNFGGANVKNVTGYEVSRFLAGSRGVYGFISKVTLFLKPVPDEMVYILWKVPHAQAIFSKLAELKRVLYSLKGCWVWPDANQLYNVLFALFGTTGQVEKEQGQVIQALGPDAFPIAAPEIQAELFSLNEKKHQAKVIVWDKQQITNFVNRRDFVLYDYLSGELFTNSVPGETAGVKYDDPITLVRKLKVRLDPAQVFIGDEFYA
jgi:hypothetical protein